VGAEFPDIEAYADHYGKLGMDAGEAAAYNGVEGAYNG
jgi:hypothetical protein